MYVWSKSLCFWLENLPAIDLLFFFFFFPPEIRDVNILSCWVQCYTIRSLLTTSCWKGRPSDHEIKMVSFDQIIRCVRCRQNYRQGFVLGVGRSVITWNKNNKHKLRSSLLLQRTIIRCERCSSTHWEPPRHERHLKRS